MKKSIWIIAAALVTGAVTYILLAGMAVAALPEGYADWTEYIADLGNLEGLEGLPTFHAAGTVMGHTGVVILGAAVMGGVITGLIGNSIAASRLMYSMSRSDILPEWFGKLGRNRSPRNALIFLIAISLLVPFLGRTPIGWIIDVNTIGAVIAYAYTSIAAFTVAKRENNRKIQFCGITGLFMSVVFFFYFMSWNASAMSTESYLVLAGWSILGFVFFRYVFNRDTQRRFGQSTLVWIALLFLIYFTSLMWVRQATFDMTQTVLANLDSYNFSELAEHGIVLDATELADSEYYMAQQMKLVNVTLERNSLIQMSLIVAGLVIMFSVYNIMSRREKQSDTERIRAEENSRAKTVFLSNMSHDIRTPMNAIVGYTNLAQKEDNSPGEIREYLAKIEASSQHLLALINDVLEMSRIESGKMELDPVPTDFVRTFGDVRDMFATQMKEKKISFSVDTGNVRHTHVLCDRHRLNRVLLNLLSNAYKFTPEGGSVSVSVWEIESDEEGKGHYEIRVKDSGIGMSPEFAAKVFEAFEREENRR